MASRAWHRHLNTISPLKGTNPGEWFNLCCRGIGDEGFNLEADLETMREKPALLIEMWHNIHMDAPTGYQPIHIDAARKHIRRLKDADYVWIAGLNEAVSYIKQRENVSIRSFAHDNMLHLKIEARNPHLPWKKFNSPLTVKVEGLPQGEYEAVANVVRLEIGESGVLLLDGFPEQHLQVRIVT